MLFQFPAVQTYTAKRAANYFSEELSTEISIKAIEIDFWNKIYMDKLYVEDLEQDTLLYVERMELGLGLFDFENKKLTAGLNLNNGKISISKEKGAEEFNHEFLFDYFSPGKQEEKKTFLWDVSVSNLNLNSVSFNFHDNNFERQEEMLDFFHLDVEELNLKAEGLNYSNDTLTGLLNNLSFEEKNGLKLNRLKGKVRVSDGLVFLADMSLETPRTALYGSFKMNANSFKEYDSFYNEVQISSHINGSIVDLRDLALFVPEIRGLEDRVYIDGNLKGTINNLETTDLEVRLNNETTLKGDFSLRGLPDFENTFIFLELEEFKTTANGIRKIPVPPFTEGKTIQVPENFNQLGNIYFTGNFTGYVTDFVAYGEFQTALGRLKTNLQLRDEGESDFHYKGNVNTQGFDLGAFLGQEELEKVSMNMQLNGSGLSKESVNARAEGTVNSIVFKNYNYKNIDLNGTFIKEMFKGKFSIKDKNLDVRFSGYVDLNKRIPASGFRLDVNRAKLARLNIFNQKDTNTVVSFKSVINMNGQDIDDFSGLAILDSVYYKDSKQSHLVENVKLEAEYDDGERFIDIKSSLVDANLRGRFKFKELEDVYNAYLARYFPNDDFSYNTYSEQDFVFKANIKNAKPFTSVFLPELEIEENSSVLLSVDTRRESLEVDFNSSAISYKENELEETRLKLKGEGEQLELAISVGELQPGGNKAMKNIELQSTLKQLENEIKLNWSNYGEAVGEGTINISNRINTLTDMRFQLQNSSLVVNDSLWQINDSNRIHLDSSVFQIQNLSIGNGNQLLYLDGVASSSPNDTLTVKLNNVDLAFVSSLLSKDAVQLRGTANGSTELVGVYEQASLTTQLQLDSLFVNDIEIGQSNILSEWDSEQKALKVKGNLGDVSSDILTLQGTVYPLKEKNSLDLSLNFNNFPLALIQPYLKGYLSGVEGDISGSVGVSGEGDLPIVQGELDLLNAAFKFDYLNTSYTINDKIVIEPDYIGFNLIEIVDSEGNTAIATGTVFHENYSDFNFDIGLEFENFFALNTTSSDNDLYYGKAFTSGIANISGFADQLIIELDIETESGTDFKIPLSEGVDVSNSNFLIFTNSPDYNKQEREEVDLSGIQLNFDLKITPEADIQIIFDEQVGDIIKAQGEGELKLEINTIGDFNMYGQYVVEKGDYLFTLQNIVNKRFDLASGSRIYWDGNPYQAILDMQAIYNLRAPLVDLFPEDTTSGFKRRVPVELELQLSSYLMNPDISFDIRLPTADENTKRRLESILYVNNNDVNPQEMNQQVFGLLVLNRFLPSASSATASTSYNRGTPGINNGYEFVSNQLSNWFSRVSDQFDVGLKYRPADELNSNEFDFSLSTEVLSDRLILDGNFGYQGDSPQYDNQYSGFIGEFTAEYKLSKDGRYRVKGFNRSVSNSLLQLNSPYTQGVGLFYREEFDHVGELWKKYFGKNKKD